MFTSTIGAGDSSDALPFISSKVLGHLLSLKTQAEDHLKSIGLEYIIIRPVGLGCDAATGKGMLSEDPKAFGYIDRTDLAELMVECLDHADCENKTLLRLIKKRKCLGSCWIGL